MHASHRLSLRHVQNGRRAGAVIKYIGDDLYRVVYGDDQYEHLRALDVNAIRIRADGSTDEQAGRCAQLPSRRSMRIRIPTRALARAYATVE